MLLPLLVRVVLGVSLIFNLDHELIFGCVGCVLVETLKDSWLLKLVFLKEDIKARIKHKKTHLQLGKFFAEIIEFIYEFL